MAASPDSHHPSLNTPAILRCAGWIRHLLLLINIIIALSAIGLWFPYPYSEQSLRMAMVFFMEISLEHAQWMQLALPYRLLACSLTAVPAYMLICALQNAREMLLNFQHGHILTLINAHYLRRIARYITFFGLCFPLTKLLIGIALTFNNPPEQHIGMLHLTLADIMLFTLGLILWILSWVIVEAARSYEESQSYI